MLLTEREIKKNYIHKIMISLLFSLFAIIYNYLNIKFFEIFNINSGIIIGLFFVLAIVLVWGWKYGVIAFLPTFYNMVDSYTFDTNYIVFFLFLYYLLWIVIHGVYADKFRKNNKWYYNKYFVETIFLIISILVLLVVYFLTLSTNGLVISESVDLSYFIKYIIAEIVCRDYLVLIFSDVVLRFNLFRILLNLKKRNISSNINLLILILVGASIWIYDAIIKLAYFNTENYANFYELLIDVQPHNFLLRNVIMVVLVIVGIIYSDKQEAMIENRKRQERQSQNLKEVLNLTYNISNSKDVDERDFITNLLNITMEVIPESDYGTAYLFNGDNMIPISSKNYSNKNISSIEISFNKYYEKYKDDETFIIRRNNEIPFVVNGNDNNINRLMYSKDIKETLFFILKVDDVNTAALSLDIDVESTEVFTDESIKLLDLLKNIPTSYYLMIKDYENKQILYKDMIISVLKILSIYDPYTNKHSNNVAELSVLLAKQLNIDKVGIEKIYWASLVHDIGKILVPKEILDKKSRLSDDEYDVVKMHPTWGYETLKSNKSLSDIADIVKHHHERWDGNGYPDNLIAEDIPFFSRIVAVADSYDAMRTDRPYRLTMSKEAAINEIKVNSKKQFDPVVVEAFLLIADQL